MEEIYASREPRNLIGFEIRTEGAGFDRRITTMRLADRRLLERDKRYRIAFNSFDSPKRRPSVYEIASAPRDAGDELHASSSPDPGRGHRLLPGDTGSSIESDARGNPRPRDFSHNLRLKTSSVSVAYLSHARQGRFSAAAFYSRLSLSLLPGRRSRFLHRKLRPCPSCGQSFSATDLILSSIGSISRTWLVKDKRTPRSCFRARSKSDGSVYSVQTYRGTADWKSARARSA